MSWLKVVVISLGSRVGVWGFKTKPGVCCAQIKSWDSRRRENSICGLSKTENHRGGQTDGEVGQEEGFAVPEVDLIACLSPHPAGLIPFLLMLGFLASALLTPPQPICDPRVMGKFIQEASKAESEIRQFCNTSCDLSESAVVPDTKVNFHTWKTMPRARQALEVWRGQALLSAAVDQARVSGQQPALQTFLARQLQVMTSTLRSVREILRGHNIEAALGLQDAAPTPISRLSVRTVEKLFSVYSNFLRGKVNLYITAACRVNGR
ncbi:erythropoietin [Hemicordylus capensis]|uniref:erythropoietin n=1 Tax=Hemicordylus capensis TaxID=884348 RepID=UPI00230416C5|nr:erythropoietin [Hemicordylus capensis]